MRERISALCFGLKLCAWPMLQRTNYVSLTQRALKLTLRNVCILIIAYFEKVKQELSTGARRCGSLGNMI